MPQATYDVVTRDGVKISLTHHVQRAREAVVVICPGFFQSKETPTFRRMAQAFADARDVIAMDFRGQGRSGGCYTFSARERADLEAVLDWACARYHQIGVLAFSLGGAIAINTASRTVRPPISLIAVSTPAAFEDIEFRWWTPEAIRTGWVGVWEGGTGCRIGNPFLAKERPIERVRYLRTTPIFFIHGTRDPIVGSRHSQRLFRAATEPKRLELMEGGGHAQWLFRRDPQRFVALVNAWFAETL